MYFTHVFETTIDTFGVGKSRKIWYRVVFLPSEVEAELPFADHPRLRVDAEIADVPVSAGFIPTGDGRRYLIVSPEVIKTAELKVGDFVTVRLRVADQDHVDIPTSLGDALRKDIRAMQLWDALTPGKKRALAHSINSAKTLPTISRRTSEAIRALRNNGGSLRKK